MPAPGIGISGLRGCLSDEALLERRLDLALEGGVLRATEAGLRRLIPAGRAGSARTDLGRQHPPASQLDAGERGGRIRPLVGENGFLGLEILSARAAGIPVPNGLVAAALREAMPQQPWLHARGGTRWDIDLAAVLQPLGLDLPPLSAVCLEEGAVELEFARAARAVATDDGLASRVPSWHGRPTTDDERQTTDEGRSEEAGAAREDAVTSGAAEPVVAAAAAAPAPAEKRAWRPDQIEAQFPRALHIAQAPAPGQAPVRLSVSVTNPTGGVLWLRFQARPFWVSANPGTLSLKPDQSGEAIVEIDPARVTRENHRTIQVTVSWSVLETNEATGESSTRHGEVVVPVEIPPPRRLFACPNPDCGQPLPAGDLACPRCHLLLLACPECEAPAARTATTCSSPEHHALPEFPAWPVTGGSAARAGALPESIGPPATPAWEYVTASFGGWSAPAIAWSMVFLIGAAAEGGSRLVALDFGTGEELWQLPLPENDTVDPVSGGPCAANGTVYVATRTGYVLSVDAASGRQRWAARVTATSAARDTTPLRAGNRIRAGCLAAGTGLFVGTAHLPEGIREAGGHVIALWPQDGATVWTAALGGPVTRPLAATRGRIYAAVGDGQLYALAAESGAIAWQQPLRGSCAAGPIARESIVLVATEGGEVAAFDVGEGTERWRAKLPASGSALAAGAGRVWASAADGSLSQYSPAGEAAGSVLADSAAGVLLLAATNGALVATAEGALSIVPTSSEAVGLWAPPSPTQPNGLAVAARRMVVATAAGVYAVDVGSGS